MNRFIVIAGKGRSGSNRLLDIFDRSAETVCRSEIPAIPGSDFHGLGGELFAEDFTPDIRETLMSAIRRSARRRSSRDRFNIRRKDFFRPAIAPALWLMSKEKARTAAARTGLMTHAGEWKMPPVLLRQNAIEKATPVLKLGNCPAWICAIHDTSPDCRVVLNIRAPCDYLNSWYNRFVKKTDATHFRDNLPSAIRILEHFGEGYRAERLSRLTQEDLVEIELWRWRYTNEVLYRALKTSDRFMIMTYEEVEKDSVAAARRAFRFAGLRDDPVAAEMVGNLKNTLFAKPASEKLDPETTDRLVRDVLRGSPLSEIAGMHI